MNLKLNSDGDLEISRGAARISGSDYVAQLISNRLKTLYGEWQLNTTIGLPWYTTLLTHNANENLIYNWILRTLSDTTFVTKVDKLTLAKAEGTRTLLIYFEVSTIYGPVKSEAVI